MLLLQLQYELVLVTNVAAFFFLDDSQKLLNAGDSIECRLNTLTELSNSRLVISKMIAVLN
jgi:hypothetical protein